MQVICGSQSWKWWCRCSEWFWMSHRHGNTWLCICPFIWAGRGSHFRLWGSSCAEQPSDHQRQKGRRKLHHKLLNSEKFRGLSRGQPFWPVLCPIYYSRSKKSRTLSVVSYVSHMSYVLSYVSYVHVIWTSRFRFGGCSRGIAACPEYPASFS